MKKLLLAAAMLMAFTAKAQDSFTPEQTFTTNEYTTTVDLKLNNLSSAKSYNYGEPTIGIGPGMMLGGAVFILAGALTVPDYECVSNNGMDGAGSSGYTGGCTLQKKPFFRQGSRMLAIMSGAVCMSVGVVISIGGY